MGFLLMIIFFVVVFFVIKFMLIKNMSDEVQGGRQELKDYIQNIPDFDTNGTYEGFGNIEGIINRGIAIDETREKLCFVKKEDGSITHELVSYKDIYMCEIVENGTTIYKTSRGSQAAGAILGGAVAGTTGAVIGGLSSDQVKEQNITELGLKITTDNIAEPNFFIYGINSLVPFKKSEHGYVQNFKEVEKWYSIVNVIIKKYERTL
ncbi:hypothetical protein PRVXT_000802 [Proteinivorax tanatarense]|uniref:Uncharacterized protein n=1 Tax=Proteinivorax tanatarense TaxID=1260629 RepID=A0AAU7VNL2_9FIRM